MQSINRIARESCRQNRTKARARCVRAKNNSCIQRLNECSSSDVAAAHGEEIYCTRELRPLKFSFHSIFLSRVSLENCDEKLRSLRNCVRTWSVLPLRNFQQSIHRTCIARLDFGLSRKNCKLNKCNKIEFTSRMLFFFFFVFLRGNTLAAQQPVPLTHTPTSRSPQRPKENMQWFMNWVRKISANTFHSQEIKCCAIRVKDLRAVAKLFGSLSTIVYLYRGSKRRRYGILMRIESIFSRNETE